MPMKNLIIVYGTQIKGGFHGQLMHVCQALHSTGRHYTVLAGTTEYWQDYTVLAGTTQHCQALHSTGRHYTVLAGTTQYCHHVMCAKRTLRPFANFNKTTSALDVPPPAEGVYTRHAHSSMCASGKQDCYTDTDTRVSCFHW